MMRQKTIGCKLKLYILFLTLSEMKIHSKRLFSLYMLKKFSIRTEANIIKLFVVLWPSFTFVIKYP